ncbi:MAG: ABC transporter permease, partial [Streptococcus sp.]|nr:ABC transporter permease [Streptococcus sp.]
MYLTLGMRRTKLFLLLLLEDLRNSVLALGVGLPISILISELISLITAKIVGLGIIEHQFSLSTTALLYTVIGFLAVKLAVFVLLSAKTANKEIGNLLAYSPSGMKKLLPKGVYLLASVLGILLLGTAYYMGMSGRAWESVITMGITVFLGTLGTILLFFGMRLFIDFLVKLGSNRKLHAYNFRQIQELVIQRSTILAICSLLIFSALCLFGAGVAISSGNLGNQTHVLDYTFRDSKQESDENLDVNTVKKELEAEGLASQFSKILQIKVGKPKENESVSFEEIIKELKKQKGSKNMEILLQRFKQSTTSHLIPVSEYNELRKAANLPPLELTSKETDLYMGKDFLPDENLVNSVLKTNPQINVMGNDIKLIGEVQSLPIVTDREITLSVALIVPDEVFMNYTDGHYSNYVSGILAPELVKEKGLMRAISDTNEKLDQTSLGYESYIQNMGRQLFYIISASYITIYLAIIFLVVANTIIGVQFLMGQRQSYRRYQTLIHLGANYETLCKSSEKQINWYFGLPIALALISSSFGVGSLLTGIVPASAR